MKENFGREQWNQDEFIQAYTFRYTDTPPYHQEETYIASAVNLTHKEGYDNVSLLSKRMYSVGTKATLNCSFEGEGCPEIILVPKTEICSDGAVRYGACFEVVLYKNGINVWRHFRDGGKCSWHLRAGIKFSVSETEVHTLNVNVRDHYFDVKVDNHAFSLRVDDIPERFHVGLTLCEGIARAYDMEISEADSNA